MGGETAGTVASSPSPTRPLATSTVSPNSPVADPAPPASPSLILTHSVNRVPSRSTPTTSTPGPTLLSSSMVPASSRPTVVTLPGTLSTTLVVKKVALANRLTSAPSTPRTPSSSVMLMVASISPKTTGSPARKTTTSCASRYSTSTRCPSLLAATLVTSTAVSSVTKLPATTSANPGLFGMATTFTSRPAPNTFTVLPPFTPSS